MTKLPLDERIRRRDAVFNEIRARAIRLAPALVSVTPRQFAAKLRQPAFCALLVALEESQEGGSGGAYQAPPERPEVTHV